MAGNAKIANLNALLTQARADNKAGNYDAAITAMQQATASGTPAYPWLASYPSDVDWGAEIGVKPMPKPGCRQTRAIARACRWAAI